MNFTDLENIFTSTRHFLLSCTTHTTTMFQQDTASFYQWVKKNFSSVSAKFEVADLRANGQGRGLIATEDISKNEVLFELSRDKILNIKTAAISALRTENKKVLNSLNQWQTLIICVAYEWYLEDKSKFIHYFNVLPLKTEDYNSLMFWNDKELTYLKPSGVLQRVGKAAAEEMYSLLVADIIPNRLKCQELADFLTLERFHIVASLIMSYSFDVEHALEDYSEEDDDESDEDSESEDGHEGHAHEGHDHEHEHPHTEETHEDEDNEEEEEEHEDGEEVEEIEDPVSEDSYYKSMVPLADTLNSNTSLVNATLKYEKTKLVMIADKPIKKGEQIFNIYGELPNSEILRKYGFVELPSSKFEFAEIFQSTIKTTFEKIFISKFNFLKESQVEKFIEFLFETIQESEYLEENLTPEMEFGIVIDKYEIYADGEVLPELLLLVLILTSVFKAAESDEKWFKKIIRSIERKPSMDLVAFTNRTILKCHQLLEDKTAITTATVENIKAITNDRIGEYPTHIIDGSYKLPETYESFSRQDLSNVVLFDEVTSLRDVVDGKFPPSNDKKAPSLSIIDDEKFLKNLMKRKNEEEEAKISKKQRKN